MRKERDKGIYEWGKKLMREREQWNRRESERDSREREETNNEKEYCLIRRGI